MKLSIKKLLIYTTLLCFSTQAQSAYADISMMGGLNYTGDSFFAQSLDEEFISEDTDDPNIKVFTRTKAKKLHVDPPLKKFRLSVQKLVKDKDKDKNKDKDKIKDKDNNNDKEKKEKSLKLFEGKKQAKVAPPKNQVIMDCDEAKYFDEISTLVATGNVNLKFPEQKTEIKAEKITYNNESNIIKAIGEVTILKEGSKVTGDSLQINLNEESAFLNNPQTSFSSLVVNAEKATTNGNDIILEDGQINVKSNFPIYLKARMIGTQMEQFVINEEDLSSLMETMGASTLNIKTKELNIGATDNHDMFQLKKPVFYHKDKPVFKLPSVTMYTNKTHDYFEGNYPEIASRKTFGLLAGPSVAVPLPKGSLLKVAPILNYHHKLGVGGLAKFNSATNQTELAYGSAADMWIARGRQQLDDYVYMQYGMNSFFDEWFLGGRKAKYGVDLIYDKKYTFTNFIGEKLPFRFGQRASLGYFHDLDRDYRNKRMKGSDIGTTRARYMVEMDQTLFARINKKERKIFRVGVSAQGSSALYGTGDTQFIGRISPYIHTQRKNWMQTLSYVQSAYTNNTPLPAFDAYRYGSSMITLREYIRVCKYLSLAWFTSLNVSNDSWDHRSLQECTFFVSFGPDDVKFHIGYDTIRQNTYFTFSVNMDAKGSNIKYDKMTIKNAEKLGGKSKRTPTKEEQKANEKKKGTPKLEYAQVTNINHLEL